MKKLFIRLCVFFLIIYLADISLGYLLNEMYKISNDNTIAKLRYSMNETNEEIIILGSSRAQHHYNSNIISKKIGLSVYNAGFGGQGLKFSYLQLCNILKRYNPKIVILDVAPNIILDNESDEKINILLPFANEDLKVYNELTNNNFLLKLKLKSKIYPFNNNFYSLIKSKLKNKQVKKGNFGFYPLNGIIDTNSIESDMNNSIETGQIQKEKLLYLDKIIDICNESSITCIVVFSPYYLTNSNLFSQIEQIKYHVKKNEKISVLDYSFDQQFYKKSQFFKDYAHLNNFGAKRFSFHLSNELLNYNKSDAKK